MLTKTNICSLQSFRTMKTLHATVAVTLNIFFFVYVHLRCIANNLKKIRKMSTLPSGVRKNFHGGFHSVAYGGHLYLLFALCDVTI